MELVLVSAVCYVIASVPTAYLIVRWADGTDIRRMGSGNVGAMNSFEITGRRKLAIVVAVLDALKGLLAVQAAYVIGGKSVLVSAVAFLCIIVGHDFSVWIRFRGGRGLAPATGAIALIVPLAAVTWGLAWMVAMKFKSDITFANYVALAVLAVVSILAPHWWWWPATMMSDWSVTGGLFLIIPATIVIMLAHLRGKMA